MSDSRAHRIRASCGKAQSAGLPEGEPGHHAHASAQSGDKRTGDTRTAGGGGLCSHADDHKRGSKGQGYKGYRGGGMWSHGYDLDLAAGVHELGQLLLHGGPAQVLRCS